MSPSFCGTNIKTINGIVQLMKQILAFQTLQHNIKIYRNKSLNALHTFFAEQKNHNI